ncbi:unnamed protein product, partial [Rotaria socialis]
LDHGSQPLGYKQISERVQKKTFSCEAQ